MANQQNITIQARGLYTFPNKLGDATPSGALSETNNVVIDRDGVISPRRGFQTYGTAFGNAQSVTKQLMDYKYRIIRHWSTTVDVDSNGLGTFTVLNDRDNNPASVSEPVAGTRIRYIEANGNLYFTSSKGIRKLSCLDITNVASKPVTPAGMVGALDGVAILNPTAGWFTLDSSVAYRVVWGIKDDNTNVVLGSPSERIIISNSMLSSLVQDYNKLLNELAIVAAVGTFTGAGTTTIGSPLVTGVTVTPLSVGMTVSGTSIDTGSVIVSFVPGVSITLNKPAIAPGGATTLTFGQKLSDTDYASLVLPLNSTSTTLYAALSSLANGPTNKLDNDIGDQTAQVVDITTVAGALYQSAGDADYFLIYAAPTDKLYSVWFRSGTAVNPNINGATAIQITIDGTETNAQVATKIQTGLNATGSFSCSTLVNVVTCTNTTVGLVANPIEFVQNVGFSTTTTVPGVTPTFATIPITPTTTPDLPTPTGELSQIQSYINSIVTALDLTTGISFYARSFIGGSFSSASEATTSNVIFSVPDSMKVDNFYQIYRSAIFTSGPNSNLTDVTPDDELQLIFEGNPTQAEINVRSINFFDDVTDSFRAGGIYLYTNANSGLGIAQSNAMPPLARDIAQYKVCTFFANIITNYNLSLGLLTGIGLVGNKLTISQGTTHNTYTFVTATQQIVSITTVAGASFSTGAADYIDIYDGNNVNHYRIWFSIGGSTAPSSVGVTLVPCVLLSSDTSTQVALNLQNVINHLQGLTSTSAANVLTVANNIAGISTSPTENVVNAGFLISVSTPGTGESSTLKQIGVFAAPTPAQQIDLVARSLVRVINGNVSEVVSGQYTSGQNDLPGLFTLTIKNIGDPAFYVTANNNVVSDAFNPTLNNITPLTTITAANPTHVTSTAHGLSSGTVIIISGSNSTPSIDGIQTVTVLDANTFTVPVNVTVAGTSGGWITTSAALISKNETNPNRIFYSPIQQPDAVPIVNFFDVGPKNKNILRILPLRNELFILSEAGVYFLTGDNPNNFQVSLFDSSVWIKAPDSAVVLNNQVFAFTTQGIATISDTGTTIISRPIENLLLPLLTTPYTNFSTATFAVNYDSDRSFLLFTVKNPTDTVATICYRFNVFTHTWTSWDVTKTCGVVDIKKDILYLGPSDINYIEVERKSFTRLDQADRENIINIPNGGITDTTLMLGSTFNTKAGDMLVQTQNLTVAQYNRLLTKLDQDLSLNQHNYYSTLSVSTGVNIRAALDLLAIKLDSDSGLSVHNYQTDIAGFGDTFLDSQAAYNTIILDLNSDVNIFAKNYIYSLGTVRYEVLVTGISVASGQISIAYNIPLIVGPITRYKQIPTSVTWTPHHFGDASMMKHVSESTVLFENANFSQATVAYASDLSPGFDSIPVVGEGSGTWGGSVWGGEPWGGNGDSSPIRTFIPVNKQRCRYISGRLTHNNTFELFSIYGISFTFSPISARGYR